MRAVPGTKQSNMKIDITPGRRRVLTKTMSVEINQLPAAQNAFDDSIESSLISSSVKSSEKSLKNDSVEN